MAEQATKRDCPQCGGKGFQRIEVDGYPRVKPCACRKPAQIQNALKQAKIPLKFRKTTLAEKSTDGRQGFKPYGGGQGDPIAIQSQTHALDVCRRLRDRYLKYFLHGQHHDEELFGLLLYGDCGRGKTRLACSLLCDLIHGGLYDVLFVEYNALFKQIKFTFNNRELSYQSLFDSLTRAKVLVIDDFGVEVSGNLAWVLDNVGYIINERYAMNLPTVITCNYWHSIEADPQSARLEDEANPFAGPSWKIKSALQAQEAAVRRQREMDDLEQRISYRLRSRIREMCYEVKVEGYDYRKRIGKTRDMRLEMAQRKKP